LRRRQGREKPECLHPLLEPVLARTLGVPLFQEQLLRMAMIVAGFSGGEAEELRRAFGFKRSEARMRDIEVKLRITGIKVTDDTPSQLWGIVNCANINSDGERIVSAIYVSLRLRQVVLVSRELKTVGMGTTWEQDNVWACGLRQKCDDLIRESIRNYADGFINDFLEMNPKN